MFSMVQVNRIYLIFNPVHFLVDSSGIKHKKAGSCRLTRPRLGMLLCDWDQRRFLMASVSFS